MMERNLVISVLVLLLCCMQGHLLAADDQSALLAFKSHITFDPFAVLATNWSEGSSFCNWIGISCSTRHHERVTSLVLKSFGFRGSIAKEIGKLSFLSFLDIGNNSFHGRIPDEIGGLRRLKYLSFQMNNLTGEIPQSLGLLTGLEVLDLSENDLIGNVPFSIFNVSSLRLVDLGQNRISGNLPRGFCTRVPNLQGLSITNNQLVGHIPSGLNQCTQLVYISLSFNQLTGSLPRDMWNLTKLQDLFLSGNNLTGTIPNEIENLSSIRRLNLRRNNFVGTLPPSLGNLSTLVMIDIGGNKIHGNIPPELGHIPSLEELYLGSNMLSGEVPVGIFNISSLKVIALAANTLSGKLPSNLAYTLPNLEGLYLGINQFNGTLPSSISNATKLNFLDLGRNMFSGNVPIDLGSNLHQIQSINLQGNHFTNDPSPTGELSFLNSLSHCKFLKFLMIGDNQFRGILPKSSLTNLSLSLERFIAYDCGIRGEIPVEIGNLTNLSWLTLGDNELVGSIPHELGNLNKLQTLRIYYNKLDGIIPESLCNIKGLYYLDLTGNQLTGQVLGCLGNISSLRNIYLDSNALSSSIPLNFWSNKDISIVNLSFNQLNGPLASEIGNLRGLSELYLSGNELFGQIPSTIGQLQNLVTLSLDMNRLDGAIPKSFGNLVSLEYLNLSHNNLTGQIPESLTQLENLIYLNISFNELSGEIPDGGPFGNFTAESFIGNTELCGPSRFHVKACRNQDNVRRKRTVLKFVLGPVVAGAIVIAIVCIIWLLKYGKPNQLIPLTDWYGQLSHKRFSYYEIARGTNNFEESNLIGKGSLGMVYKGTFANGAVVAVKVFNAQVQDAFKRFDLECEVLRNIRHRNLVKVISSCANLDFKALVLEYMPNGDLHNWLYSHNNFLDLVQRLKIMVDVASALEYLHKGHSLVVVHCDLKPSNILLDGDMVARVSDFGISKLLTPQDPLALTKTLGTIGYMAPEYGSEGIVSTMGDVYSYGILLMETFTRKKPVDDQFVGELTLQRWVEESYPDRVMDIVDANLFSRDDDDDEHLLAVERCLRLVLEIALECTVDLPQDRITMENVRARLNKIQTKFLG
ncbi:hypothetical protein HAX54_018285 [Datura stramonium]|uniref:Protein kinase domain-containing protein n=1 Tax=Datura stramonium TaxID=4076 RepID=A0ABS8S4Q4_DATST|nr:hypothetical protein [Datura stramonium]